MITIGKLSEATGVKIPTIRYYEQIGLLPEPGRSGGNQRLYGRTQQERLAFIRHARDLGFPLQAIRERLSDCVSRQAFCHGFPSRRIALRMVRSLRMAATRAALAGRPRALRRR
jgi:DNA-binding transcriptional MerR regulator